MNWKILLIIAAIFILTLSLFIAFSCVLPFNGTIPTSDGTPNPSPTQVAILASAPFLGSWKYTNATASTATDFIFSKNGTLSSNQYSPPDSLNQIGVFTIVDYDIAAFKIHAIYLGGDIGIPIGTNYYILYSVIPSGTQMNFETNTTDYPSSATTGPFIKF